MSRLAGGVRAPQSVSLSSAGTLWSDLMKGMMVKAFKAPTGWKQPCRKCGALLNLSNDELTALADIDMICWPCDQELGLERRAAAQVIHVQLGVDSDHAVSERGDGNRRDAWRPDPGVDERWQAAWVMEVLG